MARAAEVRLCPSCLVAVQLQEQLGLDQLGHRLGAPRQGPHGHQRAVLPPRRVGQPPHGGGHLLHRGQAQQTRRHWQQLGFNLVVAGAVSLSGWWLVAGGLLVAGWVGILQRPVGPRVGG